MGWGAAPAITPAVGTACCHPRAPGSCYHFVKSVTLHSVHITCIVVCTVFTVVHLASDFLYVFWGTVEEIRVGDSLASICRSWLPLPLRGQLARWQQGLVRGGRRLPRQ